MVTQNVLKGVDDRPNSINKAALSRVDHARVVQRLDNAIHRKNHYPADSVVCFVNIHLLESDLSGG